MKRRYPEMTNRVRIAVGLPMVVALATAVGCGGDGRPSRVPVSGQVLIDGEPLTQGYVTFAPSDSRAATGKLDSQGRFTLSSYERGDGTVLGVQRVAVDGKKPIGDDTIEWHAPKKYADPKTSGIEVEVTEATDELTIEISWEGKKGPFVERL